MHMGLRQTPWSSAYSLTPGSLPLQFSTVYVVGLLQRGPAELSLLGHLVQGGIVAMTWQWKGEGFRESLPLGILGHGKEEAMA